MNLEHLRRQIRDYLGFSVSDAPVKFITNTVDAEPGYSKMRIEYTSQEGEPIPSFLLLPDGDGPFPGVLVHHQHHGQRHFGKSEVCGLVGTPCRRSDRH